MITIKLEFYPAKEWKRSLLASRLRLLCDIMLFEMDRRLLK